MQKPRVFFLILLDSLLRAFSAEAQNLSEKNVLKHIDLRIQQALLGPSTISEIEPLIAQREALCTPRKEECLNTSPWLKVITSHSGDKYGETSKRLLISVLKNVRHGRDIQFVWDQILASHKKSVTSPKKKLALELLLHLDSKENFLEAKQIFGWLIDLCSRNLQPSPNQQSINQKSLIRKIEDECTTYLDGFEQKKPTNYTLLRDQTETLWAALEKKETMFVKKEESFAFKVLRRYLTYAYLTGQRQKVVNIYNANENLLIQSVPKMELLPLLEIVCTSQRYVGKPNLCFSLIEKHSELQNTPQFQIEKALTYHKIGDHKQSLVLFETLKKTPDNPFASWIDYYSSYIHYSLNDFKRANELLDTFVAATPGDLPLAISSILKIRILARQGKHQEARNLYEKSILIFKKNTNDVYYDTYLLKFSFLIALLIQKNTAFTKDFLSENHNLFKDDDPAIHYYHLAFSIAELRNAGIGYTQEKNNLLKARGNTDPDSLEYLKLISNY